MRTKIPILLALALALAAFPPGTGIAATEEPLEGLDQSQLQEAFRVLSQHYIENDSLDYEQLNKAALEGLLRRLSFGAELVDRNGTITATALPFAFHEETIADSVAYLRPVTFDKDEVTRSKAALEKFDQSGVTTLILDLRAPVIQVEFARAAAFVDLFTARNQLLFKVKKPSEDEARLFLSKSAPLWERRLVILIDRETSSVAETVAAVLQRQFPGCLSIGQQTLGKAVQYQEIALSETTALRFASAEVLLPDDARLFRKGVVPDLTSITPSKRKQRIFAQSGAKGMAHFTIERERPRMNEAALVAGVNPELDYYLLRSNGLPSSWDRQPLQDQALQTALESLLAIDFIELPSEPPAKAPAKKKETPAAEKRSPAKKARPSKKKADSPKAPSPDANAP